MEDVCAFDTCKKHTTVMKFQCRFCHQCYCIKHQLPEKHTCDVKGSDTYDEYRHGKSAEYLAATDKKSLRIDNHRLHRNVEW